MPTGLKHPDIIEQVSLEKNNEHVTITIREDTPWDGSDERMEALRKKINNYVAFALGGQLAKAFPALVGKPVGITLRCIQHRPDERTLRFITKANADLASYGIAIKVLVIEVTNDGESGREWWKFW